MRKLFLFSNVVYFLGIAGGMYLNDPKVITVALACAGVSAAAYLYFEEEVIG